MSARLFGKNSPVTCSRDLVSLERTDGRVRLCVRREVWDTAYATWVPESTLAQVTLSASDAQDLGRALTRATS